MKNYAKYATALFFISMLINIGIASADTAQFGINRDAVIKTTGNSITSGSHLSTIQYYMYIFDYTGSQTLNNISFSPRLSTNVSDWDNKKYATVNGGNADWLFPSTSSIENTLEEIGVWFASNNDEMKYVGTDASINVIPITFSSDGYQQVNLTVTYRDISNVNGMWGNWVGMWISDYDNFQASFVQGSLYSDAPVKSYEYHSKGIMFYFDPDGIILNKPYTFSARVYVDINNSQVVFRPGIDVGRTVGISDVSNPTPSYSAVALLSQLSPPLNSASAGTDLPLVWTVHTEDNVIIDFNELFETQGSISTQTQTATPTPTFTVTPTPTPTITPTPTSGSPTSVIKGDVSGDGQVTVVDALFVSQYTVGARTLTSSQLAAADVNGDGQVTVVDALFIAQYTVGLRQL